MKKLAMLLIVLPLAALAVLTLLLGLFSGALKEFFMQMASSML